MIEANVEILQARAETQAELDGDLANELGRFLQIRRQIHGWNSAMGEAQKQAALDSLNDRMSSAVAQRTLVDEAWAATEAL